MAWIVLVVSGVLETVWAAALSQSRGFTRLGPSMVFGAAAYGMAVLGEPATAARLMCLVAIVGGVVGLKFLQ